MCAAELNMRLWGINERIKVKMRLYDLKAEYDLLILKVNQLAEENEGVIPDEMSEKLDQVSNDLEDKIINCGHAYKNYLAEAEGIDSEIKRLTGRKNTAKSTAEWLKKYMASCVPAGYKYTSPTISIGWRNSKSVVIDNEAEIPEEFFKVEKSPKKTEIKKAIESGFNISGAHIEEKQNIQIK